MEKYNFPKLGTGGGSQLLTLELAINNGDLTNDRLTWERAQHLRNIELMLTVPWARSCEVLLLVPGLRAPPVGMGRAGRRIPAGIPVLQLLRHCDGTCHCVIQVT